jgi:threonine dehydrogenase-like Zn-dependent dehydrogenase
MKHASNTSCPFSLQSWYSPLIFSSTEEVPKPRVVDDRDVVLKVTGSTVCGSDLHLLHGTVIQMQKGDILGHEFCGVVESMGKGGTNPKKGDRVVASFQIACGEVLNPNRKVTYNC